MQTHLIPVREVRPGDRLHYLAASAVTVEQVTTESISGRSYICLHHAAGVRHVNVFGHVHREVLASSSILMLPWENLVEDKNVDYIIVAAEYGFSPLGSGLSYFASAMGYSSTEIRGKDCRICGESRT